MGTLILNKLNAIHVCGTLLNINSYQSFIKVYKHLNIHEQSCDCHDNTAHLSCLKLKKGLIGFETPLSGNSRGRWCLIHVHDTERLDSGCGRLLSTSLLSKSCT